MRLSTESSRLKEELTVVCISLFLFSGTTTVSFALEFRFKKWFVSFLCLRKFESEVHNLYMCKYALMMLILILGPSLLSEEENVSFSLFSRKTSN